jgi:hypothetical protein
MAPAAPCQLPNPSAICDIQGHDLAVERPTATRVRAFLYVFQRVSGEPHDRIGMFHRDDAIAVPAM